MSWSGQKIHNLYSQKNNKYLGGDFGKHSIYFEKIMQGDELPMFNENVFAIWLQKVSSNARLLFIISV